MADDPSELLRIAFDRLVEHVAARLRFGPVAEMPPGLRERVRQEVVDALEEWRHAERRSPPAVAVTPLQRLLAAYVEAERLSKGGSPPNA